jgi:hypothetical protein
MRDSRFPSRRERTLNENLEAKFRSTRARATRIGLQPGASLQAPDANSGPAGSDRAAPEAGKLEELVSPHRNCRGEKKNRTCQGDAPMTRRAVELTGQTFGAWTVIKRVLLASPKVMWQCRCECGTIRSVAGHSLTSGGTRSCGCRKRDNPQIPLVPPPAA